MTRKNKRPVSRFTSSPAPVEFNPDYTMVKKDLRRIGLLAGIFFASLIILSFFIN